MTVQRRQSTEDELVIRYSGELDAGDTGFGAGLLAAVGAGYRGVIVDLLNVSFIDSSVVGALVVAHGVAGAGGGWLRVVYTHHMVRRVIEMCGFAGTFPQYPTIEAARRDMPSGPPSSEVAGAGGRLG